MLKLFIIINGRKLKVLHNLLIPIRFYYAKLRLILEMAFNTGIFDRCHLYQETTPVHVAAELSIKSVA